MMLAPWEMPSTGNAAGLAAGLAAHVPTIETARLHLRAPRIEDFAGWAEIACGPAGLHLGGPFDRKEAFTDFAATVGLWLLRGHGLWTMQAKSGAEVLGFVLIGFEPDDHEAELGYLLRPSAEGRGFATEAAQAVRDYGFRVLQLSSLVSYIAPGNDRSIAVAERLGARRDPAAEAAFNDEILVFRHQPEAFR